MAGGIDTSKWKPRQTRGTPSYKYRNYFALSVIAVGCGLTYFFNCLPFMRTVDSKVLSEKIFKQTEEEIDRKLLMPLLPQKTSRKIIEIIEEDKKIKSER